MSRAGVKQQIEVAAPKRPDSPPMPEKRAGQKRAGQKRAGPVAGVRQSGTPVPTVCQRAKPGDDASAWMGDSGFIVSRALAELIKPTAQMPKKQRG